MIKDSDIIITNMSNYKLLNKNAKVRLNTLICRIYSSRGVVNSIIKENGIVHLIEWKLFGIFKIGPKKSIHDLLYVDLPRDISSTLYHSDSFISDIREAVSEVTMKYEQASELVKTKHIIDLLYNLVFSNQEEDEIWKKLLSRRKSKNIFVPESNVEYITPSPIIEEEREHRGLLYIFNGFFKPKREYIRRTVQLCTLFLALNAFRIVGLIPTYEYLGKGKPYIELLKIPVRALFDSS